MWDSYVDLIRTAIFVAASLCNGSLGSGILVMSFAVRLGLLPLTLRLARDAREQQQKLATLRPDLERLRKRYAADPARYWREASALMRREGVRPGGPVALVSVLVQTPLLFGLIAAVRNGFGARVPFLWIADLARGDLGLTLIVSGLAVASAAVSPSTATPAVTAALIGVVAIGTVVFLWSTSSAVALSVGAGSVVSVAQSWLLARDARKSDHHATR